MITQEFDLDLVPDQEPVVVHVNQYDIGTGRLVAHLYNEGAPYTPAAGAAVVIQGTKPDRIGFMYDAAFSGNTVTADLTEQMCAVAGRTVVNIIVNEDGNRTGTFNFFLEVQKAALGNDTVISRSDGSIYDIPDLVESAERSAEDAEAWAVGQRNGSDVDPADGTYRNNAKYYAGEASGSADSAGDSAENAEAWAKGTRGGSEVPSTDETYRNNSKYYAEQAEGSAEHAAEIVDDANYLIGVDPSTIQNPATPYLRPSDIKQAYFSFTAHDASFSSTSVTIPAGSFAQISLLLEDHSELLGKKLLEMGIEYESYSSAALWWVPAVVRQTSFLVNGTVKEGIMVIAYNPQSSPKTLSRIGMTVTYV